MEWKMYETDSDSIAFSATAASRKASRTKKIPSERRIAEVKPLSNTYHSCLELVQSCLWRCLSTSWYHSGKRKVKLSGVKSRLHSFTFQIIWLLGSTCCTKCPSTPPTLSSFLTAQLWVSVSLTTKLQINMHLPATNGIRFMTESQQTNKSEMI